MPSELRDLPEGFREEVRLFPLPNLVFFPHNIQPLHIFESRYREMMKDALAGDQLIALATLKPGFEVDYYSRPPLAPVACVGRITHHEENEDGTYNLLLAGLKRIRIGEEITPVRSFRRARIAVLEEEGIAPPDGPARQCGQRLLDRLVAAVPAMSPLADEFGKGKLSLGVVTDVVAFHLPLPLTVKLDLLAETDAVRRTNVLLDFLPRPTSPTGRRSFPPTFGTN